MPAPLSFNRDTRLLHSLLTPLALSNHMCGLRSVIEDVIPKEPSRSFGQESRDCVQGAFHSCAPELV